MASHNGPIFTSCCYGDLSFPNRQLRLRDLAVYALQGSRNDIITIVLATIVASALSLVIPYFTGVFIDDIVPLEQRSALAFLGVGLFAAVLGASLLAPSFAATAGTTWPKFSLLGVAYVPYPRLDMRWLSAPDWCVSGADTRATSAA